MTFKFIATDGGRFGADGFESGSSSDAGLKDGPEQLNFDAEGRKLYALPPAEPDCYFKSRDRRRSLRIRPSVWQCGQYDIT
jgi:hypothetical protein